MSASPPAAAGGMFNRSTTDAILKLLKEKSGNERNCCQRLKALETFLESIWNQIGSVARQNFDQTFTRIRRKLEGLETVTATAVKNLLPTTLDLLVVLWESDSLADWNSKFDRVLLEQAVGRVLAQSDRPRFREMKRKIESSGKIWNDWKKFTPGEQCRILVALLDLKGRIAAVQQQNEELRNRKSKGGTRERGTLLPEALTVEDLLNCAQSTERLDPPNSRDISPRFLPVRRQTLYRRRLETRARAEYNRHTRTACSSELGLNAPVTDVPISSVIQSPRYPPTPFDSIPHNQFQHALQNFPSVPTFPSNAIPFPHYHPQPYPIGHRSTPHSSFVPSSQGTLPFDNYQPNPLDPLVNTFGGTHHYPPQAPLDYDPTHDPSHNGPLPASLDPSSYPYGFSQPIAENFHSTPPYWYTPHPNHF